MVSRELGRCGVGGHTGNNLHLTVPPILFYFIDGLPNKVIIDNHV